MICAVSDVAQSPVLGRSVAGSLIFFLHNPSGGAENDLVANSRRLRKDSSDRPAKIGVVASGVLPHKCVVVSEMGGGVIVMPLTDQSPTAGSSFLRHSFGFAGTVTVEDDQSDPSIEIEIVAKGCCVVLVVRMDCVGMYEEKRLTGEPSIDQSFVSELVADSFRVGVVFSEENGKIFFVPDFGSGRHSSRGLGDLEAIRIWPGACWDAKKSGGVRLFTSWDRDGACDAGMAAGVTSSSGLSCLCHRRRWVGLGVMVAKLRIGHTLRRTGCLASGPPEAVGAHRGPVADFDPVGDAFRFEFREARERWAKICLPCLSQSEHFFCERAWICERIAVVPSKFHSPSCGTCLQVPRRASDKIEGLQSVPSAGGSLEVFGRNFFRWTSNLTLGTSMGDAVFAALGCQSALANRMSETGGEDLTHKLGFTNAMIVDWDSISTSDLIKLGIGGLAILSISWVLRSQPDDSICLPSARLHSAPDTASTALEMTFFRTILSSSLVILSTRFGLLAITPLSGAHQRPFSEVGL